MLVPGLPANVTALSDPQEWQLRQRRRQRAPRDVRRADHQRRVTELVAQHNAHAVAADAGADDLAQRLVVEVDRWVWVSSVGGVGRGRRPHGAPDHRRGPRANPVLAGALRTQDGLGEQEDEKSRHDGGGAR